MRKVLFGVLVLLSTVAIVFSCSHNPVTPELLVDAILWSAGSKDQDFRDETWSETSLNSEKKAEIKVGIKYPESGFKAFYVDLKYKAPFGDDYTQSTRMFVANDKKLLLKAK